jgi:hypothetical protein
MILDKGSGKIVIAKDYTAHALGNQHPAQEVET